MTRYELAQVQSCLREQVKKAYKRGKQEGFQLGYQFAGTKMTSYMESGEQRAGTQNMGHAQ